MAPMTRRPVGAQRHGREPDRVGEERGQPDPGQGGGEDRLVALVGGAQERAAERRRRRTGLDARPASGRRPRGAVTASPPTRAPAAVSGWPARANASHRMPTATRPQPKATRKRPSDRDRWGSGVDMEDLLDRRAEVAGHGERERQGGVVAGRSPGSSRSAGRRRAPRRGRPGRARPPRAAGGCRSSSGVGDSGGATSTAYWRRPRTGSRTRARATATTTTSGGVRRATSRSRRASSVFDKTSMR